MKITIEWVGKALGVLRKSIQECAIHRCRTVASVQGPSLAFKPHADELSALTVKVGTRECGARKTLHSMVRLQMTITYECVGKALGVLRRSIQECVIHQHCGLGKSACFFRMTFIVYRKCLRTFIAAQQHLRRFPRVSAGIAQNSLR